VGLSRDMEIGRPLAPADLEGRAPDLEEATLVHPAEVAGRAQEVGEPAAAA
jgi:hypothetical protein